MCVYVCVYIYIYIYNENNPYVEGRSNPEEPFGET